MRNEIDVIPRTEQFAYDNVSRIQRIYAKNRRKKIKIEEDRFYASTTNNDVSTRGTSLRIDESGRIEFGLGFAEDKKKKREHAETTIVLIDRFEQVRCCALNFV